MFDIQTSLFRYTYPVRLLADLETRTTKKPPWFPRVAPYSLCSECYESGTSGARPLLGSMTSDVYEAIWVESAENTGEARVEINDGLPPSLSAHRSRCQDMHAACPLRISRSICVLLVAFNMMLCPAGLTLS